MIKLPKTWICGCMRVLRLKTLPYRVRLRTIYSETGVWDEELTTEMKFAIEKHWGPRLHRHEAKETSKEKFYVLSMFPYPSGALHLGHVRVYTISDVMARYHRMCGKSVIHPMGWDAFGLPAENAAIEGEEKPDVWTQRNIANMKAQLQQLGCSFDWGRELSTCDPQYYRWTQQLFLLMLENGLAYQKEAVVNWDPVDETVLADEQVDENGCSWRSGAKAETKLLRQWFLKTTAFAKALSDGLSDPTLEHWADVPKIQQHWIGECDGVAFQFQLKGGKGIPDEQLTVWTNLPEAFCGVTFIALASKHALSRHRKVPGGSGDDCRLDVVAVHPLTGREIPIYISDNVTYPFGADAYMGIPGEVEADNLFAKTHGLKIVKVLKTAETGGKATTLINSLEFSDLSVEEAREKICSAAKSKGFGGYPTSSKLRDWLISRQRYWGTPIPVIHCPQCKVVPVPFEDLPVVLPKIESLSGKGTSVLKQMSEWRNVLCPRCGSSAQRETDTMDTFVDSSWYYLRFLDPHNLQEPFSKEVVNANMPVDFYIGGKEHAALHLFYARFVNHFCHSLGLTRHREPFKRLLVQGMVLGQAHRSKAGGKYLKPDEVEERGDVFVEKSTGDPVVSIWEKMSKSRYNGIDPKDVIDQYGTDSTRLFMLADFSPTANRNWESTNFWGKLSWQKRLWLTVTEFRRHRSSETPPEPLPVDEFAKHEFHLFDSRNYCVRMVTFNFHQTFQYSIAVAKMQILTNDIRHVRSPAIMRYGVQYERALAAQIIMLAPITPHFASELWAGFAGADGRLSTDIDWDADVLGMPWPEVDMNYHLPLVVKVNGEEAHVLKMARTRLDKLTEAEAMDVLQGDPTVAGLLTNRAPTDVGFRLQPGYEAEMNFTIPGLKILKKRKKHKG